MKKRLLAALLSVALFSSNLGINTYAMEEISEVNVVQEEEAHLEEEELQIIDLQEDEKEETELPECEEGQEQESETESDGIMEDDLAENPSNEGNLEDNTSEEGLLETEEDIEIEEKVSLQILGEEIHKEDTENIQLQSTETMLTNNSNLRQAVVNAKDGDTINLNGYTLMVNDDNSNSEPWLIDKAITIKNGRIDLRAGGIILGKDVTFDGIDLVFANTVRNVIVANGHTLKLHNTTRALNAYGGYSAQNVHLFCGTMYGKDENGTEGIVGTVRIPAPGPKGEIIITGENVELGNIYAGNISTTAEGTVSAIPAEITVDVTGNSTIGMAFNGTLTGGAGPFNVNSGIYAGGAIETPGSGLTLNTNYIQCPPLPMDSAYIANVGVNAPVIIHLKGVNDNTVRYVYGDTYGTGETTVKFSGTEALVSYLTLVTPKNLEVLSGKLAPSSQSNLLYSSVKVAENSYLGFTYMRDQTLDDFTGEGGTIVLKPEQTLTIEGTTTGQTLVGIGANSYGTGTSSAQPVIDRTYIATYGGSQQNAFSLLPYEQNAKISLVNESGFAWVAKEEGGNAQPSEPSSFKVTDSDSYNIPTSTVGISIQPIDLSEAAEGGVKPYFYEATNLPEGINLNRNTGIITGTPTKAQAASEAVITITDSSVESKSAEIRIVVGEIKEEEIVADELWKIRSIDLKEDYESFKAVPETQVVYDGFEVIATDGNQEFDEYELSWVPVQFTCNGTLMEPMGEEEEYYYYLLTIEDKEYLLEFIGTVLYIYESEGIAGLPEGTYKFEMIIPESVMENNRSKALEFTIISGEPKEEIIDAKAPVVHVPEAVKEYGLNEGDAEILITAEGEVDGKLSFQWYENQTASNKEGTSIEGATNAKYSPSTDKAGKFYYYCVVTNTKEDATGEKTAITVSDIIEVIVKKGNGTGTVSMDDWIYGEEPARPGAISQTNGNDRITYTYSGVKQDGDIYEASKTIPTEAGTYKVKAVFEGNEDYEGFVAEDEFVIRQKEINISEVKIRDKYYNGTKEALVETIRFTDIGNQEVELILNQDYTVSAEFVSPEKGVDIEAVVTIVLENQNYLLQQQVFSATGNIVGVQEELWMIGIRDYFYTGKAVIQEELRVYHHDQELVLNQDYTVKYKNNVKAGTAAVTITGKGNYTGTITEVFQILPLDISKAVLSEKEVLLPYNGKVQKATVTVSYPLDGKEVRLKAGTDFTFIYPKTDKNDENYDRNAFFRVNEEEGYQVLIVGKGNYTGEIEFTQKITSKILLSKLSLTRIADQKYSEIKDLKEGATPEILLKNGKIILIAGKEGEEDYDYTVEYKNNDKVGTATAIIKANPKSLLYAGTRTATFKITGTDLNKAKITGFVNSMSWSGEDITQKVNFVYTTGSGDKREEHILTENEDYKVEYLNNKAVGTATVIYTGMGEFTGTIKKTFKITGVPMSRVSVAGLSSSIEFYGENVLQDGYQLIYRAEDGEEKILRERKEDGSGDYTVTYKNNHKAGTASIIFTGVNGYTGQLTKSFKITAYDLKQSNISMKLNEDSTYPFVKGGVFPEPTLTYTDGEKEIRLEKGRDYTVTYFNHKNLASKDDLKKAPTIKVTGKGGYQGIIEAKFTITEGSLAAEGIKITASDIVYQDKANLCKPVIAVYDSDGKKLVQNTDYQISGYTYVEDTVVDCIIDGIRNKNIQRYGGENVQNGDVIPTGTKIKAGIVGTKNYDGSKNEVEFAYVNALLSKAKVTVKPQVYNGKEIELEEESLTVKIGKDTLSMGTDYEIVAYTNRVNKGSGKVTLRGIGNYGGEVTVSFKIDSRNMNDIIRLN